MSADPSVPLSYANRASSLAKEQTMPMQRAPAKPAPAKKAQPPPSPSAAAPALSSPTAANGSAAAAGVTSPQRGGGNNASPLKQAAAVNPLSSSSVSSSSSSLSSAPSASSALTSPAGGSVKVVKAPRTGYALVKAVQSGDTLVVIGNAPSGQTAPEKTIIISGIQAPKFAKGKNQTDEVNSRPQRCLSSARCPPRWPLTPAASSSRLSAACVFSPSRGRAASICARR